MMKHLCSGAALALILVLLLAACGPKAPGGSSAAFSEKAKEKNLLVVPGDDFGCPEFFRLSTCVAPDMIQRSLPVFRELIGSFPR